MMRMCEILEMENIDKGTDIELLKNDQKRIFFLKKGTVKITDTSNNHVKYIVKKGNIFGELSLYNEQEASQEKAIALEDCVICYIEADRMDHIMQKHTSLKNGILKVYGMRIKKLERRLQDLVYKDSHTRIKEFIIDYINEFGEEKETKIVAKNLLSHRDIANLTNTSRQTVNNVMSTLRKNNTIDYTSQYILITKKEEFNNI